MLVGRGVRRLAVDEELLPAEFEHAVDEHDRAFGKDAGEILAERGDELLLDRVDIPCLERIERHIEQEGEDHRSRDVARRLEGEFAVEGEIPQNGQHQRDRGGKEGDEIHILDNEMYGLSACRDHRLQNGERHKLYHSRAYGAAGILDCLHERLAFCFLLFFFDLRVYLRIGDGGIEIHIAFHGSLLTAPGSDLPSAPAIKSLYYKKSAPKRPKTK